MKKSENISARFYGTKTKNRETSDKKISIYNRQKPEGRGEISIVPSSAITNCFIFLRVWHQAAKITVTRIHWADYHLTSTDGHLIKVARSHVNMCFTVSS